MKMVTIGTRGSALALVQAEIIKKALQAAEPNLEVAVQIIKTEGDQNSAPIPLDVIGKGWFTKEIEEALLNRSIDIAVHSLKDLPEILPTGLHIAAYAEREDARDALVSKHSLKITELPRGAIVGTDSLRRKIQLLALRSDLIVTSIRGNVPTRLQKLESENYDAVVLAAAGLKRLHIEDKITQYFTMHEMLPAPGQGMLAAEARIDDMECNELLQKINNATSAAAAGAERAFARSAGGGCKSPTGAYALIEGDELVLEGMLAREDGSALVRDTIRSTTQDAIALGTELAARMLEKQKSIHA